MQPPPMQPIMPPIAPASIVPPEVVAAGGDGCVSENPVREPLDGVAGGTWESLGGAAGWCSEWPSGACAVTRFSGLPTRGSAVGTSSITEAGPCACACPGRAASGPDNPTTSHPTQKVRAICSSIEPLLPKHRTAGDGRSERRDERDQDGIGSLLLRIAEGGIEACKGRSG